MFNITNDWFDWVLTFGFFFGIVGGFYMYIVLPIQEQRQRDRWEREAKERYGDDG